jgi:hypothetical protein
MYHLSKSGLIPTKEKITEIMPLVRAKVTDRKKTLTKEELKNLYMSS